jgi:hypothetical protein
LVNTEFERLRSSIDYINAQMAKGYLEKTPERVAEVAAAQQRAASLSEQITRIEAKLKELEAKPDIADVTVGIITDPNAVQNVAAGAAAAVQAAQPSVPTLLVPMAVVPAPGGMGPGTPITSYDQLYQEFLRQQIPGNAAGGMIRGPGSGTSDSILSWLSNGEYVMRSAAVSHYGADLMRAINSMSLPKFAAGGAVGAGSERFSIQLGGGSYTAQIAPDAGAALRRELRREIARRGTR